MWFHQGTKYPHDAKAGQDDNAFALSIRTSLLWAMIVAIRLVIFMFQSFMQVVPEQSPNLDQTEGPPPKSTVMLDSVVVEPPPNAHRCMSMVLILVDLWNRGLCNATLALLSRKKNLGIKTWIGTPWPSFPGQDIQSAFVGCSLLDSSHVSQTEITGQKPGSQCRQDGQRSSRFPTNSYINWCKTVFKQPCCRNVSFGPFFFLWHGRCCIPSLRRESTNVCATSL